MVKPKITIHKNTSILNKTLAAKTQKKLIKATTHKMTIIKTLPQANDYNDISK